MSKMPNVMNVQVAVLLTSIVGGCATGPRFRGPIQLVSNAQIVVIRATARQKPEGIVVGGDVRRTNGFAGGVPGHLEVVGWDVSGKIVASTNTSWGEFMSRRFRLAYFRAILRTKDPSSIATIRVESVTP